MTRKEHIEEKAKDLAKRMIRSMVSREELYSACILMAEWADQNPVMLEPWHVTENYKLTAQLAIAVESLKYIEEKVSRGDTACTWRCYITAGKALAEIEKLKNE